ncbi:hypothetical protein ACFQ0M_06295 [Kitasatospora aburaviensis]
MQMWRKVIICHAHASSLIKIWHLPPEGAEVFGEDVPRSAALRTYEIELPKFRRFSNTVEALTTNLCNMQGIKYQTIEARAKELESLERKLARHPDYQRLSDAEDLCGVRIVTFYLNDVDAVRDLIRREFDVLKEESRRAASLMPSAIRAYM